MTGTHNSQPTNYLQAQHSISEHRELLHEEWRRIPWCNNFQWWGSAKKKMQPQLAVLLFYQAHSRSRCLEWANGYSTTARLR